MKVINLRVLDEFNEQLHDCGVLNPIELTDVIDSASQCQLINISLIDINNDTYFNNDQLKDVEREIVHLGKHFPQSAALLACIKNGIDLTRSEGTYAYLKFEVS